MLPCFFLFTCYRLQPATRLLVTNKEFSKKLISRHTSIRPHLHMDPRYSGLFLVFGALVLKFGYWELGSVFGSLMSWVFVLAYLGMKRNLGRSQWHSYIVGCFNSAGHIPILKSWLDIHLQQLCISVEGWCWVAHENCWFVNFLTEWMTNYERRF